MAKPAFQPLVLSVKNNVALTPNMHRLTFACEAFERVSGVQPAAYIKFMFDLQGNPLQTLPANRNDVLLRTYTIRAIDSALETITVDMALHGEGSETGPASRWARNAKEGEQIWAGGPGSSKGLADNYDWVLLVGDMTSLPAISGYLESLPMNTKGYAVIQISSEEDQQNLSKPDGMTVIWVKEQEASALASAVAKLEWLQGEPAVWVASEFSAMREMRQLLRNEKQVSHGQLYISSYWRKGRSEDQHKIDKRNDQQSWESSQGD